MRRRSRRAQAPPPAPPDGLIEVEIASLGAHGDGIGHAQGLRLFVPQALPGDRLRVRLLERRGEGWLAEPAEQLHASPRAHPACRHFGHCGGCQLQHLPAATYARWRHEQVALALARRGLADIAIKPLWSGQPGTRRRLRLAYRWQGGTLMLGLRAARAHRIVPLRACPISVAQIEQLLPACQRCLEQLPLARAGGELQITATESGLDLLLIGGPAPCLQDRELLARLAQEHTLARIAWRADVMSAAEPVAALRPVETRFEQVPVELPPGAFLQASDAAEQAIRAAVIGALGPARRLADLYAGCGALGLPLAAAGRSVLAIEQMPEMVAAMRQAAARARLADRLQTQVRDLAAAPLAGHELAGLDGVVLDPPRAGAAAQVAELAATPPARIAMVSCNPTSFARDAACLVAAGYRMTWVQPIDAFLWSSELELVAAFLHGTAPTG